MEQNAYVFALLEQVAFKLLINDQYSHLLSNVLAMSQCANTMRVHYVYRKCAMQ